MTIAFRDLAMEPAPERFIPAAAPWVVEAGNPYLEWFFGRHDIRVRVERWMRRPSSEVAIQRAVVLEVDGIVAGGYIFVPGAELRTCRMADAVAALAEASGSLEDVRHRMRLAKELFPLPPDRALYLSKLGVLPPHRGGGLGGHLLDRFIEQGLAAGCEELRLDVHEGNVRALDLYQRAGFRVLSRAALSDTSIAYVSMARAC